MNYVFLYLCPLGTSLSFSFSFSPSLSRFISSQSLAVWLALANEILANIMPQSPKSACLLVTLPPPWKSPNSSLEDVKTCRVRSLLFHPSHPQTSPPKVKCKCEPSPLWSRNALSHVESRPICQPMELWANKWMLFWATKSWVILIHNKL